MSKLAKLGDWLLLVAALILPGFITVGVLYLLHGRDDDWKIF